MSNTERHTMAAQEIEKALTHLKRAQQLEDGLEFADDLEIAITDLEELPDQMRGCADDED